MGMNGGRAQGTIEYLVIVAIIVIIGLLTVSMTTSTLDAPASQISSATTSIGSRAGAISILQTVSDISGNGLITLQNSTDEFLTVTKISADTADTNYNSQLGYGEKTTFYTPNMGNCACTAATGKKQCTYTISYTSGNGLQKKIVITSTQDCVANANQDRATGRTETPVVLVPPVVLLSAPQNGANISSLDFNFVVSSAQTISSCTLSVGGVDRNTTANVQKDTNVSMTYAAYLAPASGIDWGVRCTDSLGSIGTASGDFNTIYYFLASCTDLSNIRNDMDANYLLASDINCYTDTHSGGSLWNGGQGFTPIGTASYFTGSLDGRNHAITGLFINNTTLYDVGIFGLIKNNTISNLRLLDVNISMNQYLNDFGMYYGEAGALVGYNESGTIRNVSSSGRIRGNIAAGGIAGMNFGKIYNSSSTASIDSNTAAGSIGCGTWGQLGGSGGITGANAGDINDSYYYGDVNVYQSYALAGGITSCNYTGKITNSYSRGTVNGGNSYLGGLVGVHNGTAARIYNSYSVSSVTGSGTNRGILIGRFEAGAMTNSYYFASGGLDGVGYGTETGTATTPASNFYSTALDVYDTSAPLWNFTTTWYASGSSYPTLR